MAWMRQSSQTVRQSDLAVLSSIHWKFPDLASRPSSSAPLATPGFGPHSLVTWIFIGSPHRISIVDFRGTLARWQGRRSSTRIDHQESILKTQDFRQLGLLLAPFTYQSSHPSCRLGVIIVRFLACTKSDFIAISPPPSLVLGLAWLPSDQYPGIYGLNCMRAVWQELIWTSALCLGLFGGLSSLHQATPGLMSSCGRFFICRGYIFVFVTAWLNWLLLALPTGLLLSSTLYQARRNLSGDAVWKTQVDQFEYFWPGQASPKIRPFTYAIDLPRQPDSAQIKSTSCDLPLEDEKHRSSPPPEYS
ncbi:hypothetical protein O181_082711 [Austropuccinia psidii MF-1]|uniref:Uncharacterized protein n=1 Tax=Austropuccinia psidii MF-1 TaxID=1389203 RepID=A0A9Q3IH81_9BASI|nr:hypothetical protein [Austropuccinia psidii MF-1]